MDSSKDKGDLGQIGVAYDLMKKGYKIMMPYGENWPYDLVAVKDNRFVRIQVKYTVSNGIVVNVKTRSTNNTLEKRYTDIDIDYMGIYDKTTDDCYYVSAEELGVGLTQISLRLVPSKNNQVKNIRMAKDYKDIL